jgi:hypothetical protein
MSMKVAVGILDDTGQNLYRADQLPDAVQGQGLAAEYRPAAAFFDQLNKQI